MEVIQIFCLVIFVICFIGLGVLSMPEDDNY